jgi:hypothetical protein
MRNLLKKIIVVFFAFLALSGSVHTIAQITDVETIPEKDTFKQVEIIVFSKIQATSLLSEQWNMPTLIPDIKQATELTPFENEPEQQPQELQSSYWKLNKISRRLSRNGYAILLHLAWVQDFSQTQPPIHVFVPQDVNASGLNTQMGGTIDITLNRYFNVAINLLFGETATRIQSLISPDAFEKNFHNVENGIAYFQLKQRRRMKSDELNYIDHPLYGMLIKITSFSN